MPELKGAVRELSKAIIEIFVYRAGEDQLVVVAGRSHIVIVQPKFDIDVGVVQHPFEHPRKAMLRHRLELVQRIAIVGRSEEHTSELQSLMRISYAVFCLKKKNTQKQY